MFKDHQNFTLPLLENNSDSNYSTEELLEILKKYATQFLDDVTQDSFVPRRDIIPYLDSDDEVLPPAFLDMGLQLLLQIIFLSHRRALMQSDSSPASPSQRPIRVLAPETMAMEESDDEFVATVSSVPETQAAIPERIEVQEPVKTNSATVRKRPKNVFINSFKSTQEEEDTSPEHHKMEQQQQQHKEVKKFKIPAVEDKYRELNCVEKTSPANNKDLLQCSEGVLGNGLFSSTPYTSKYDLSSEDEFEESPSLLERSKKARKTAIKDDDFVGEEKSKKKMGKKIKSDEKPNDSKLNKFGIPPKEIKADGKRLKQRSIETFIKSAGAQAANSSKANSKTKEELDTERAIELSNITYQAERDLDDSFDELPDVKKKKKMKLEPGQENEEPNFKFASSPVRKKAERAKLLGFECRECAEFYKGEDLSDTQREELVQKCSKHRAKHKIDLANSPSQMWKIDIDANPEQEKTQMGSPLKVRSSKRKL